MLKIKDISKSFHDKKVLDHISFNVQQGEIAILLGSSGVGKSTLLRILNNLETMDTGSVFFNGAHLNLKTVNQQHIIGMVFQQFNLFDHLTVLENITLPIEKTMHKTIDEARAIAHPLLQHYVLQNYAHSYPHQLSGGQKQRLALARALALKPQIICLDEPTSALDPLLTAHVAQTMKELAQKNYIVLITTHDVSLLEKLPCTIHLMQAGKIIETASRKEYDYASQNYPHIKRFIQGSTTNQ